MGAKLLFVGDIHLGRRPSRLPADLRSRHGLSPSDLNPAAAWRDTVDLALRERVDAVVLAGDVVEADNARFEAFGPLSAGARRLVDAGIELVAVAGNHDVEALPLLAAQIPEVRLLGLEGRWELATIRRDGEAVARVAGWSFPARLHGASPFASGPFPEPPEDDLPFLAVLHADLDAAGSRYAPVGRAELRAAGADAFFLGHVHAPSDLSGECPVGYLGSLVGLDPGEFGPRGPWLVRHRSGELDVKQVPLAPLRWERLTVPVGGLASAAELELAVTSAIRGLDGRIERVGSAPSVVGCRIELTGATAIHGALARAVAAARWEDLEYSGSGTLYFVEKVIDSSRPALDLESLAAHDHPPGLLARRLLALLGRGPDAAAMIEEARRVLEPLAQDRRWAGIPLAELDEDRVRGLLIDEGYRALEGLLEQAAGSGVAESAS